MARKYQEIQDPRRTRVVDRPSQGAAPKPDWQRAHQEGQRAREETAMRLRHELGLSTSDSEIRKLAAERTEDATRRALRDAGEG